MQTDTSDFRRFRRRTALLPWVAALALAGCGQIIQIDETTTGKLEIAPVLPCGEAVDNEERLIGVHLRQSDVSQRFEMLSLSGTPREARLPRVLEIEDQKTRLIATSDQEPDATRRATAAPRSGFSEGDRLPAVYDLSYRADDVDLAGPLVVGNGAVVSSIPTTGRTVFRGPVQLSRTVFSDDGSVAVSTANARFAAVVGYGSGRATFVLSDITPTTGQPMPFVSLEWRNLGICGARVVSTGQGTVRLLSEDGRRVSPFVEGRGLPTLLSSFESMQFDSAPPPAPPAGFGGIFSIESDLGTLAAVFLSQPPPQTSP